MLVIERGRGLSGSSLISREFGAFVGRARVKSQPNGRGYGRLCAIDVVPAKKGALGSCATKLTPTSLLVGVLQEAFILTRYRERISIYARLSTSALLGQISATAFSGTGTSSKRRFSGLVTILFPSCLASTAIALQESSTSTWRPLEHVFRA